MSDIDQPNLGHRPRWVSPRRWRIWSLSRPVLAYVLTVDVAALATIGATITLVPITPRHWLWFGLLAGCAVVHLEAARGIERIREIEAEGSPHTHLQSVWLFAGVLVLPPPLLAALITVSYSHAWVRVYRRHAPPFRKVFSAATVVLGCAAAGTALVALDQWVPGHQPFTAMLNTVVGLVAVVAAGVLYWLVNYALVVAAILATNPDQPGKRALGSPSDQLLIAGAIGLATGVSLVITEKPLATPLPFLTVLALHLGLLVPQYRAASETDRKTGLLDSDVWRRLAKGELGRAHRLNHPLGVLMIDLDHFKKINDTCGHLAGDAVLRAVADTIRHVVRGYDAVGRLGGEEIGVLLPELGHEQVWASAERIRLSIETLRVRTKNNQGAQITLNVTASIGAAVFPDHGTDYTSLMLAADTAVYDAKKDRNQTIMSPTAGDLPLARQPTE